MTWVHPPDSLLEAFMSGTLGDGDSPEAVRIALHLDACPACSARSAALDPMARGFASMDGPAVPEGLVDAVARAALAPDATPTSMMLAHAAELAVAAGLLLAATGLFVAFGSPGDVFVTAVAVVGALAATTASLAAAMVSPIATATFIAGVGLAASVVTVGRHASRSRKAA